MEVSEHYVYGSWRPFMMENELDSDSAGPCYESNVGTSSAFNGWKEDYMYCTYRSEQAKPLLDSIFRMVIPRNLPRLMAQQWKAKRATSVGLTHQLKPQPKAGLKSP